MPTSNYNLPTISGNMNVDVVRDVNALAEAIDENLATVDEKINQHVIQTNADLYRLSKQGNNAQREIAYLKLKQDAADRIENGTTFANDFSGNSFGITFNEAESTNATLVSGGIVMAETNETVIDREDITVVNQTLSTEGNGGRKLVRLQNGLLVAGLYNSTSLSVSFYVSNDNGGTWTQSSQSPETGVAGNNYSLESKGNNVYIIFANLNTVYFRIYDFENNSRGSVITVDTVISSLSTNGISITINEILTELHAVWSNKNNTNPGSFNLRYAKGVINGDGSVTWGAVEQWTSINSSGADFKNPTIAIRGDSQPIVLVDYFSGTTQYTIWAISNGVMAQTANTISYINQNYSIVYQVNYSQSSPSAIYVPPEISGTPNGRIWVAWHGLGNTDVGYRHIYVSFSDDGGVNWSTAQKLTNGNTSLNTIPSISFNIENDIFVVFDRQEGDNHYVASLKYDTTWGAPMLLTPLSTSPVYPSSFLGNDINFTIPLFIYRGSAKVGFYGTWTVGTSTPTTTASAVFDIAGNTDFVGAFIEKQGDVSIAGYLNNQLMDSDLEGDEYQFTKQLSAETTTKLRLELSRDDTTNGNDDRVTRILGGLA